jgi:hypothetical protein
MLGYCSIADAGRGVSYPIRTHRGMWRSVKVDGILGDTANLS